MDLKAYYKKIREVESAITEPFVIVASLETADGGRSGSCAEVSRPVAARLITEGRVRLTSEGEATAFRESQAEARSAAEAIAATHRMQVMLVPNSEPQTKLPKRTKD